MLNGSFEYMADQESIDELIKRLESAYSGLRDGETYTPYVEFVKAFPRVRDEIRRLSSYGNDTRLEMAKAVAREQRLRAVLTELAEAPPWGGSGTEGLRAYERWVRGVAWDALHEPEQE